MTEIISPTTELEAVNKMLATIGEAPVSTLSGASVVDVTNAQTALTAELRAVQKRGWHFNTEYDYPLTPDNDGFISLPQNTAKVMIDRDLYLSVDPVQRGTRLYDIKNRTYVFSDSVTAKMVFFLPFEELPESARHYIFVKAARVFQQEMVGSDIIQRYTERDEAEARADFIAAEQETRQHNFADSRDNYWIKLRRVR